MTTSTKPRWDIPRSFFPLALLTLIGVGLAIYRLTEGLGPTTNLNDHFPWGLWITLDVFLIPIGGAAFTTSLISHFFHDKKYHAIVRPAVLAGFLCYSLVGVILLLDLGRWQQFYNFMLPQYMNLHSFLWEVAFCVTFYTIVLVLELAPTILEKWNIETPKRLIERGMMVIAALGVVLSSMHQSSIGSLFILMSHKLHAIWWTPLLPLLYFMQALFSGLALAALAITLTQKKLSLPVDRSLIVDKMGKLMRVLLAIYLAIMVVGWLLEGELGLLFSSGAYSLLVWAELIIGVFVPLGILFSKLGQRRDGVLWAGVFIIMGVFFNRLIVSWVGLSVPAWATYVPHWMEVMISVGFIAGAFLVYAIVARYFELFPEKH
ncbi:MAG: polysulfide reductase NrfD [Chloroflexi bacterium]|nr:polysulfide reductase NrfD [Chloroflexota bacterium]